MNFRTPKIGVNSTGAIEREVFIYLFSCNVTRAVLASRVDVFRRHEWENKLKLRNLPREALMGGRGTTYRFYILISVRFN